jgi:hypothetical protein
MFGETIDERRLRQVIDDQIAHGVHGICVLGSTGGNGSFSDEEMRNATGIAAKHAAVASRSSPAPWRAPHRRASRCRNMPRRSVATP